MMKNSITRRRIAKATLCASVAVIGMNSVTGYAATWTVESSLTGTPTNTSVVNPTWSTVYRTGTICSGAPTTLTNQYINGSQIGGKHGGIATDQPLVAKNLTSTIFNGGIIVPPNTILMHPGPNNQCSVLKFTVPANQPAGGLYLISAHFRGAYPMPGQQNSPGSPGSGDGTRGMVLVNSVQQSGWSADTAVIGGQGTTFSSVTLNPGDTVEYAAHMKGSYLYDSTLLTGRIIGPDPVVPEPVKTCCDPNLSVNKIQPLFNDYNSTNITGLYGLNFDPTTAAAAGFRTAFDNTAFMASVTSGLNGWLVVHSDMKTDNAGNQSWPTGPTPVATYWNLSTTTTNLIGSPFLYWENTPLGQSNGHFGGWYSTANMGLLAGSVGGPHMKKDGTRYAIKFTYWLYYIDPQTQVWMRRPVECTDMKDQYLGYLENTQTRKVGPGGTGGSAGIAETADRPAAASQRTRMGKPEVVDQATLQSMPADLRAKMKK